MTTELIGNKAIEDAAITWVMHLERAAGREPHDTRHAGAPGDIESSGRIIEVKAAGGTSRGVDLWLEARQVEEARSNRDFFLYLVENVKQGDPRLFTLRVFGGAQLARMLERVREKHYFELPVSVSEYDSAPTSVETSPSQSRVVGVDGMRGGWAAVELRDGRFVAAHVLRPIETRFEQFSDADVIAIDVPIGFGPREADAAARRFLGRSASTVFTTPRREVLLMPFGPGLGVSAQSHALGPRILHVTALAASNLRIREVHPEVSFKAMNGNAPLSYKKKSTGGALERLELLRQHGIELRDLGEAAMVPVDDVLDAAAAAWSAHRIAQGVAKSLPDPPEIAEGRPVAIWF